MIRSLVLFALFVWLPPSPFSQAQVAKIEASITSVEPKNERFFERNAEVELVSKDGFFKLKCTPIWSCYGIVAVKRSSDGELILINHDLLLARHAKMLQNYAKDSVAKPGIFEYQSGLTDEFEKSVIMVLREYIESLHRRVAELESELKKQN